MDTTSQKHWARCWDIWALLLAAMLFLAQMLYFFTSISVPRIILITLGATLVSCALFNVWAKKRTS